MEQGRKDYGILLNYMAIHDSGGLETDSSAFSKDYLKDTVINPLKNNKSVLLQDGEILSFEELDRLALSKLIYYHVRDHVYFPHINTTDIAGSTLSMMGLPEIIKFPSEVIEGQHGACADQTLLLATLLKMEDYEVAICSGPSMAIPIDENNFVWFAYHNFVYLKDEGWGIGTQTFSQDIFGKE